MSRTSFAGWFWDEPQLLQGTESTAGIGRGFLAPTPLLNGDAIWLFGSPRDDRGRGTVTCIEVHLRKNELAVGQRIPELTLPPGKADSLDENGVILGDILLQGAVVRVTYVGFASAPGQKFVARTGVAVLDPSSGVITRSFEPVRVHPTESAPIIEAVHCIRATAGGWEALYAVGHGWEEIGGARFPRYDTFAANGSSQETLRGASNPLLPRPDGVYRLGRPRWFLPDSDSSRIVATGGRRTGDYRPYVFELGGDGRYVESSERFPFNPGDFTWCARQLSYPAAVHLDDETAIMFMNGDQMGRDGCFAALGYR